MTVQALTGILMITSGAAIFAVSQLFLRRWIKRYNKEWMEGADPK